MSTTEKGNRLEDDLYEYLLKQYKELDLIYGVYPASLCKVHRKKSTTVPSVKGT